jgi:hypothetical protein
MLRRVSDPAPSPAGFAVVRMNRLIAAALALGVTAAVALATLLDTGRSLPTGSGSPAARIDPYCGQLPPAGADRPPNIGYAGSYLNRTYGYAVTIPSGLTGYNDAHAAPRGFGIVLSRQPPAFLHVDAAYDVLYDITAAGVHLRDRFGVRLFDTLLQESGEDYSLAGVSGGRYRMTVRCAANPQTYLFDSVIVVRDREIYRVDLQSVPQRYRADEDVMDAMLRTWRWVAVQHQTGSGPSPGGR